MTDIKYKRLRDLREDADKTQAQVAQDLGLYTTTYARYERGEKPIPFYLVIEIAKYYNVSLDYIAEFTNIPKTLDGAPWTRGKGK